MASWGCPCCEENDELSLSNLGGGPKIQERLLPPLLPEMPKVDGAEKEQENLLPKPLPLTAADPNVNNSNTQNADGILQPFGKMLQSAASSVGSHTENAENVLRERVEHPESDRCGSLPSSAVVLKLPYLTIFRS